MPNVVLLISDEHNPRYASVYGHPFVRTPHMERLAARGTVYDAACCPSPLCVPARAAFMTGKYVHEIQVYSNVVVNMEYDYPTWGSVLAGQGVHTVHVGKVHVHNHPDTLGFSEMLTEEGFHVPTSAGHGRTPLMINVGGAKRADGFGPRDDAFDRDLRRMERTLDWLHANATTLDRPWVLSVNLVKPHFPHYVTPELWKMYDGRGDLPAHGPDCETARHPYMRDLREHFETERFTEEQVRGLRRGYYGGVTFVDEQLGRLLDTLDASGILDDTVVIYTTDHGEMLGKFGMWWKCTLLEDAVRVPLIAAGPGFGAGARVTTPVDLLDVQATIFRAVDAARPDDWRGAPLQDLDPDDSERVVFSEYHGHGTRSGAFMIRKGDWKLIHCMDAPDLLFNVADDPEELHNRLDAEPRKAAELEAELRKICSPERENERAHAFERRQFETLAEITRDSP
ncbi:MAG TPA: sulfatase-like hydrolase/transferase [Planctomycetota bacterium]|nr:sulfatase-like hydrolase/transferase [Planctomycetota bacterium]